MKTTGWRVARSCESLCEENSHRFRRSAASFDSVCKGTSHALFVTYHQSKVSAPRLSGKLTDREMRATLFFAHTSRFTEHRDLLDCIIPAAV
jgi:hypothetical protein